MYRGAFCSGFLGPKVPVSWPGRVYSQEEKGPLLAWEASPLQHADQKCHHRWSHTCGTRHEGGTHVHREAGPTYTGRQGGIYTGWYTHQGTREAYTRVYTSLLRYPGGSLRLIIPLLRYPGGSLRFIFPLPPKVPGRLSAPHILSLLRYPGGSLRLISPLS